MDSHGSLEYIASSIGSVERMNFKSFWIQLLPMFIMFTVSGSQVHIVIVINPFSQLEKKFREAISKPSKSHS